MAATTGTPVNSLDTVWFEMQAAQYYIAGRHATFCAFVPVAAILFHHAVEMALKAYIRKSRTEISDTDAIKMLKRQYGHSLTKLWATFLVDQPQHDLTALTPLVERLDAFEDFRYPTGTPGVLSLVIDHDDEGPVSSAGPNVPILFICLEDVDILMSRIWTICQFDIEFLRGWLTWGKGLDDHKGSPYAEVAYYQNNRHALYIPHYEAWFTRYDPKTATPGNMPSNWKP